MNRVKFAHPYYFSVPGETEKWYLHWLRNRINEAPGVRCKMKPVCWKETDPVNVAKKMSVVSETKIMHFFDYESGDVCHQQEFKKTLSRMKEAESIGKQIVYVNAYSNFTFDLWLILHKADCPACTHRKDYIKHINKIFGQNFEDMHDFKREDHFKSVLCMLSLADVKQAIGRAKQIEKQHAASGHRQNMHAGYRYYRENPSTNVGEIIEKILTECGVL